MQISIAEAHNRLSYWLKQIDKGPITITRRGRPVGVILSMAEYEHLRRFQAYQQILSLAQSLRERDISAGELFQASREELEERP